MREMGEAIYIPRSQNRRRVAPALLAICAGAVIVGIWGMSTSKTIAGLTRAAPQSVLAPVSDALSDVRTQTQDNQSDLRETVQEALQVMQARERASAALAEEIKQILEREVPESTQ